MKFQLPIVAVIFAMLFEPASISAHDGAVGIIKERMEAMLTVGRAMKDITRIVRSERPLHNIKIAKASGKIGHHAGNMSTLFPVGSTNEISRASLKIWESWDEFTNQANKLGAAANGLARVAIVGDETKIIAAHRKLQKSCGNCHKQYRLKKKKRQPNH
jgi:cytochrome c556